MLYLYNIEGLTQGEIARRVNLDRSQVSRRLSRARRYRQEVEQRQRQERREMTKDGDPLDRAVHVELITASEERRPRGAFYDMESGVCSIDGDELIAVGSRNGASALGGGSDRAPEQRIEGQRIKLQRLEFGLKNEGLTEQYQPDPDGLAGGLAGKPTANRPKRKAKLPETAA